MKHKLSYEFMIQHFSPFLMMTNKEISM